MSLGLVAICIFGLLVPLDIPETPTLVAENGVKAKYADGVLDLRASRGWLRTEQVFLDFQLAFEFRAMTPETDAAVLIRTWVGRDQWPGRGFRVPLPTRTDAEAPKSLVGLKESVTAVQQHPIALRPGEEWQHLRVEGRGKEIRITLNGMFAGVFEIERFGGHVMFENRQGHVQIRNLTLGATEPTTAGGPDVMLQRPAGAAVKSPELLHEVQPLYTPEAMRRRIEGVVGLEAMVLPDGAVGMVRVTKPLDPALDVSAIAALKAWKFAPATRFGRTVPTVVSVEMRFVMRR